MSGDNELKMSISSQTAKNKLSKRFSFSAGTSMAVYLVPGFPGNFQAGLRTSMLACNKAFIGDHQAN